MGPTEVIETASRPCTRCARRRVEWRMIAAGVNSDIITPDPRVFSVRENVDVPSVRLALMTGSRLRRRRCLMKRRGQLQSFSRGSSMTNTTENPFAADFRVLNGKGVTYRIYIKINILQLHLDKLMLIIVKRDARVDELIGYTLCEYLNN
ncbi:hypothetical protein BC830DRAFT_805031 [Chytriomyces sp. MP71]|nr:hypothetical protein BC830DRAFT_805031 [Chytriomyces sp. MP71]